MGQLLSMIFCIFSIICLSQQKENNDYKIYSALLKANQSPDSISFITVIDSTENFGLDEFILENEDTTDFLMKRFQWKQAFNAQFDSLGYQALTNYYFYPKSTMKLKNSFLIKKKVKLISLSIYLTTKDTTTSKNRKGYPTNPLVFHFSNIYYSGDQTRAALRYHIYDINGLHGFGKEVIFAKENSNWTQMHERVTWYN